MATATYEAKYNRWRLRIVRDGHAKTFYSYKKGLAGKRAVIAKAREWEYGGTASSMSTVRQCWDNFMEMNACRIGAQSESYKDHEKFGRLYILPAIGRMRMQSITKFHLQHILNDAKPHDKRTKVLSKKYLTKIRSSITQFMKFCTEYGYHDGIKGDLYIPQGHTVVGREILQPAQIKKLFEPSELTFHKALCFMVCTGVRPGEAIGLKWSDVDHKNGVITINRSINTKGVETQGKNKNARRLIPLTPLVSRILDEQRAATRALQSEWIFCNAIGERGNQSTLGHHYDQLAKERGFGGSPYALRHTFVSMVKNTMPEQLVKTVVGHSVSMDTFGVYGHVVDGELKQAAEIMDLTFNQLDQEIK